jgi:hypothetical protein
MVVLSGRGLETGVLAVIAGGMVAAGAVMTAARVAIAGAMTGGPVAIAGVMTGVPVVTEAVMTGVPVVIGVLLAKAVRMTGVNDYSVRKDLTGLALAALMA